MPTGLSGKSSYNLKPFCREKAQKIIQEKTFNLKNNCHKKAQNSQKKTLWDVSCTWGRLTVGLVFFCAFCAFLWPDVFEVSAFVLIL